MPTDRPAGTAVWRTTTPAVLDALTDVEIVIEALRWYPGTLTWGTAMLYRHPDDNAELKRREERAKALAEQLEAARKASHGD